MNYFQYGTAGALPEIPQFSNAPYCLLVSPVQVVYSSVPIVVYPDENKVACGGAYEYYGLQTLENGGWQGGKPSLGLAAETTFAYEGLYWANHDIKDENGTLYLAASDPVPVSPDQNDPALLQRAFWKGFAAGIPG